MADGHDFDAVFYVKSIPEIRLENGMFHVCYAIGRARFEFVLRPSLFQAARKKSAAALKDFEQSGDVSQLKRH